MCVRACEDVCVLHFFLLFNAYIIILVVVSDLDDEDLDLDIELDADESAVEEQSMCDDIFDIQQITT